MKRRHLFIPPWVVVALGAGACNADAPLSGHLSLPLTESKFLSLGAAPAVSIWTLVLTDTGGRIWVAQTTLGAADTAAPRAWAGPATLWSRLDSAPLEQRLTLHLSSQVRPESLSSLIAPQLPLKWELDRDDGTWQAGGQGQLEAVRGRGGWRSRGRAMGVFAGASGMREPMSFDLISDTPLPPDTITDTATRGRVIIRTPAIVSLRIDDCMAADRVAFVLLQRLRLTAEMAVPSRRIDRLGYCSQLLLDEMVAAGDLVESHSRWHGPAPPSFGDFYLEVVGSAQDLRRRGFDPLVFIPPGTWRRGPTLMDSPGKLVGPYAQLLRRVYVTTESYALPAGVPIPVLGREGPKSLPLRAFSLLALEWRLRNAATDSQWIAFMWHAWDMTPAELEARLQIVAALRDSGLVTVLPYYTALHVSRQ